jgi:pimeloyl-ACP methyl ester carboxylesterase
MPEASTRDGAGAHALSVPTDRGPLYCEIREPILPWVTDPETIVFCHGVAIDCGIWASWLPVLAPRYRTVLFDTRGFGRSAASGRSIDWSLDLLSDDILAVAGAAGVERFHLVGESMGGTVCLNLAARAGSPLASLACVSTSHRGAKIRRVGEWRERATREGMSAWSGQMMDDRFAPGVLPEPARRWFSDVQQRTSVDALLDAADMLVRTDLSAALPRIGVPTLLLAPDSSPFLGLEIPADIHRLIPGSEVAVFPGVRHGLAFSHGPECATLLLRFLERRAGRRET